MTDDPSTLDCVAALDGPLLLSNGLNSFCLPLNKSDVMANNPRLWLYFEGIIGHGTSSILDVYINIPNDETATDKHWAGSCALYGMESSSSHSTSSHGDGLNHTIELTPILATLKQEGNWQDNPLKVTLRSRQAFPHNASVIISHVSVLIERAK
ncbi:hypothetical protein [Shewanella sp. YLB-07]|uniref:DUF7868 domain-containing protein n=1 Tax=Shewanella sp. YLB-07 TaxID=2601268 RepID=UPI00128D1C60|nr:hypothetical protein [Shewanella sp. YLB-07]MPY24350.1 hypothetical protein [Shewanella sp. YLB-07]